MIIKYYLESKLVKKRELDIKKFDTKLKNIIRHIYPSMLFKISDNIITIKDVPIIYADSIKNTLEKTLKNLDFQNENNITGNDDSLINLMFKSFSLKKGQNESFLKQILNIKIEYHEDLFFYSNNLIQNKPRLKLLYENGNKYFYKINYNSKLHTNSSLKLFNDIIETNSQTKQISVINNPSTLFKFQFKLDDNLNLLKEVIKVYKKSEIEKLLGGDIVQYEKYFKYITFLDDKDKKKELENIKEKKDIHKEVNSYKKVMFEKLALDTIESQTPDTSTAKPTVEKSTTENNSDKYNKEIQEYPEEKSSGIYKKEIRNSRRNTQTTQLNVSGSDNLCIFCNEKPKYEQHPYCGRRCFRKAIASGWKNGVVGKAKAASEMCAFCKKQPVYRGYSYCGQKCGKKASALGWIDGVSPKKQQKAGSKKCAFCDKQPAYRGYSYCGRKCGKKATALGWRDGKPPAHRLPKMCAFCKTKPMSNNHECCSRRCGTAFERKKSGGDSGIYQESDFMVVRDLSNSISLVYHNCPFPPLMNSYIKTLLFYENHLNSYIFANFYPSPFEAEILFSNGHRKRMWFNTTEHYFQAHKFIEHPDLFKRVVKASSARETFELAREMSGKKLSDEIWHKGDFTNSSQILQDAQQGIPYKITVMLNGLRYKFNTKSFKQNLINSKNLYLIENAGANDGYWGNGCGKRSCQYCSDGYKKKRHLKCAREHARNNNLGKLLMHVRCEILFNLNFPQRLELVEIPGYMEFK